MTGNQFSGLFLLLALASITVGVLLKFGASDALLIFGAGCVLLAIIAWINHTIRQERR